MDAALLEREALLFPDAERAFLVERLMESISRTPTELRAAWVREADERMQAFREGKISAVEGLRAIAGLRSRPRRCFVGEVDAAIDRFPYAIIRTRDSDGEILIVSIFHQSREPLSWKRNL